MRPTTATPSTAQSADALSRRAQLGLKKACQGFEAIFIREMLATARSTSLGDGILGGDNASEITDTLRDDALADTISGGGGLGVAQVLERELWPVARAQALARAGGASHEG
jgi:peptidoglycan hydrolase FlgJ